MLKKYVIFVILAVSSNSLICDVKNCEFCSPSSPQVCINCNTGYKRSPLDGCIEDPLKTIDIIENCKFSVDFLCITCNKSFRVISGRCDPICPEDCECFAPEICLTTNSRPKNQTEVSSVLSNNCPENCKECISERICSLCKDGFSIDYDENCKNQNDTGTIKKEKVKIILLYSSLGAIGGGIIVDIVIL